MVSTADKPLTPPIPVLLIRGLSREQRHWGRFRDLLAAALPNPVLSLDFAGCGALYQQRSPARVAQLRQSVRRQLLQSPCYNGRVHLVAMSLGGMLAADWALVYPAEVASVSLINSSARPLSAFYQRLNWRNYAAIAALLFADAARREQRILQLTTAQAYQDLRTVRQWQTWQQQRPVSIANAVCQLWAASRFRLNALPQCPALIISSKGDQLVSAQCSAAIADYWQAPLLQHPWAGHDIALDDPHWLAGQIAGFIQPLAG